jgi:hypothetical protein
MSVFEELIDELKQEDLLEETIFSVNQKSNDFVPGGVADTGTGNYENTVEAATEKGGQGTDADPDLDPDADDMFAEPPADEREVYRRRAVEEVSSLQMVEHVLSGIEREHMKMTPAIFDDLAVKKALHQYLQINAPINSDEHSAAEYHLYQETEKWFSALSGRDNNISVANVRRFCENSRPVLSSQALMALARFYRNSPYSESVRGKFDFVMTRLFSREIGDEKRKLLFGRIEMLGHIQTLYGNWASLSIIGPDDENAPSVGVAVAGFEAFVRESESADAFDQLIASDFFNRIRLFKEQANEMFFEPSVASAAIECNVRIGNRFIDLIQKEREATSQSLVEEKYGYSYDTIISNATSKTLLLVDLLKESRAEHEVEKDAVIEAKPTQRVFDYERAPVAETASSRLFTINKWIVIAGLFALILTGGLFFWSENAASTQGSIEVAPSVNLEGSDLRTHLLEASTSSETLYGITQPTWDALSAEEQRAFLSKAYHFATSQGLKKVNFLNARGRTVAFASENRLEVLSPQ